MKAEDQTNGNHKKGAKPELPPEEVLLNFAGTLQKSPAAAQCLKEALLKSVATNAADEVFQPALSKQTPVDDFQTKQP